MAWINFLVEVRRDPSVSSLLTKGMAKSNNITLERLEKGYENLLSMAENGFSGGEEVEADEFDDDDA